MSTLWRPFAAALALLLAAAPPASAQSRPAGSAPSLLDVGDRPEHLLELDAAGVRLTTAQKAMLSGSAGSGSALDRLLSPAPSQPFARLAALTQDFQAVAFPPTGWAAFKTGAGTGADWARVAGVSPNFNAKSTFSTGGAVTTYLATPQLAVTAADNTVSFKMWQNFTAVYNSTYAVLVSTTSQTDPNAYTVVGTWTETTACPGGTGAPAVAIPAARNCTVSLAAYNGQNVYVAFRHTNDDGDTFNLDDVLGPQIFVSATPVFAQSPSGTLTFAAAGTCSTVAQQTQLLTITNTGGGSLVVNSAAITGASAFSITGAPAFPVTLTNGQSTTFTVVFAPGTTTGTLTGTLTVNYNNGTAQTATTALTGTGLNPAITAGAGIAAASNVAGCGTAPTPAVGFINPVAAGHTRGNPVTTATPPVANLDDGNIALNLATTYPGVFESIRIMGRNQPVANISTNGIVTFNIVVTAFYGVLPVANDATLQVGAMDLNFNNTTYATDNTGVAGLPGIFYGLSDANGDGLQDLVITYWHAYDFGSAVASNAAARYFTAQAIIYKGARPNQDDIVEIRYPQGNDANGVPFFKNLAVGGSPSIVDDISIGIGEIAGLEAAIYRNGAGVGGPITTADPVLNLRFEPQTQATASGAAGYRLMGAPITTLDNGAGTPGPYTVARLADLNLVQGVMGQYPTVSSNLLTGYNGTTFTAAANVTDVLAPGRGFFWYVYNVDCNPTVALCGGAAGPPATDGTSKSYTLPMPLQATGAAPQADVTVPLISSGDGFNMIANPFRSGLSVSPAAVTSWATGGTLASAIVQTYNPTTGTYQDIAGDVSSAWQGFFVQNATTGGATSLVIPASGRVAGGTFVGRDAPTATLAFELNGTAAATGATTTDVAAKLAVASEVASDGWDLLDASKLTPPTAAYATIGFQGTGHDGLPTVKAHESRATNAAAFDVPMVIDAVGTDAAMTLSWDGLDALPATWQVELRDLVTGTVIDLRTQATYAFDQSAEAARTASPEVMLAATTTAAQAKASSTPRFVLHVTTGRTTATEGDAVTEFALSAPAPNPTAGAARVAFALPTASDVTVVLYDLLGRRVATLSEGQMAAGRHEARLDAGALAPGVYVVRMQAGTFAATQRVTVVR